MQYLLLKVNDNFDNLIDLQTLREKKKPNKLYMKSRKVYIMCFQYKNG